MSSRLRNIWLRGGSASLLCGLHEDPSNQTHVWAVIKSAFNRLSLDGVAVTSHMAQGDCWVHRKGRHLTNPRKTFNSIEICVGVFVAA